MFYLSSQVIDSSIVHAKRTLSWVKDKDKLIEMRTSSAEIKLDSYGHEQLDDARLLSLLRFAVFLSRQRKKIRVRMD